MSIGNRLVFRNSAAQPVTNSTVLVDATGFSTSVAANQIVHARFVLPFSVGAAGGVKIQIVVPAAPANIVTSIILFDNITPAVITAVQITSTAFANALAAAGNHILVIECDYVNGVNAGTFKLQFAQNGANATPVTLMIGGIMDVVKL